MLWFCSLFQECEDHFQISRVSPVLFVALVLYFPEWKSIYGKKEAGISIPIQIMDSKQLHRKRKTCLKLQNFIILTSSLAIRNPKPEQVNKQLLCQPHDKLTNTVHLWWFSTNLLLCSIRGQWTIKSSQNTQILRYKHSILQIKPLINTHIQLLKLD